MTLGRAASLFEIYNPPSGPAAVPTTPTVNAVICRYCKGNDHKLLDCPKKKPVSDKRGLKNPIRLHLLSPVQPNASGSLALLEVKRCLAQLSNSSNRKPSVGWGTTKQGWGRADEFSEGSK